MILTRSLCLLLILKAVTLTAQEDNAWPRSIETPKGSIVIYQPQPESFTGNKITGRFAVSYTEKGGEPLFGAVWADAKVSTDRDDRSATLESIKITNVKFPADEDSSRLAKLRTLLETEIPKWNLEISLDQLAASLEMTEQEKSLAEGMKNDPPKIIYETRPSLLVVIDGDPKVQKDSKLGMDRVVNTPFPLVKNTDGKFYLYIQPRWFSAATATGEFAYVKSPPKSVAALESKLKSTDPDQPAADNDTIPAIVTATTPTELIQSRGVAKFNPIQGTNLLYMANSDNDIFMDITSQHYFVLLSGRWYNAANLKGPWTYIASDKLPADFKNIPEGSDKDNVLSSVAGTDAAKEALADAQVPQTAKVDRKKATTTVTYDGTPKFEKIEGTDLEHAVNTSSTVLKSGSKYYAVDNGVWFESTKATGPWKPATSRPADVEKIPPSNPTYNVKYVYIYETTPEYIYMGYTPGYVGCYPYGPTVVYGTGYYYAPWYGAYYYPRPVTWGFSMHYNPWTGWSMGVGFSTGGFHMSFYGGGGYWGPPMYRPPYRPPYGHYYGGRPVVVHHNTNININNINNINHNRTNNLYNHRNDVATSDVNRGNPGNRGTSNPRPSTGEVTNRPNTNRPTTKPATTPDGSRMPNNVQTDRNGNIYQQQKNGDWMERQSQDWKKTNQSNDYNRNLNKTQQSRDRGQMHSGSFQQTNRGGGMGGGMRGGGGMGGGGRRR
jgi:hypothetical protein